MGDLLQDQDGAERQPPTHSIVDMLHQELDPCKVSFGEFQSKCKDYSQQPETKRVVKVKDPKTKG